MTYQASGNRLEARLPSQVFFRANRHQIININFISSIATNVDASIELTLNNQTKVEVSRRQSSAFKKLWSL
ncbi:LytTR family transcriptional regulator DNA-binding domain-containing protein [Thalassomonas sp. RHCl1]|uniref:LytTR family transcriptional regulator DNA-binding domain-containing protein n=1 Tax=Thalassomonas sp. RHCl1 TaxID=2995320 RepID=UPI00248C30A6|nr:LytTR family transcriptional regulator DNA-binding domain-containing protein [Thalassomonas sp. RHCl1]